MLTVSQIILLFTEVARINGIVNSRENQLQAAAFITASVLTMAPLCQPGSELNVDFYRQGNKENARCLSIKLHGWSQFTEKMLVWAT